METSDQPSSEIAREIGVRFNQLYKWRDQLAQKATMLLPAKAVQKKKSELTSLKQENTRLKEEIEILKKAAAYFARKPRDTDSTQ